MNSQNVQEDLRSRRTKKLLYEALLRLLKKKSFQEITVNDICREAMLHRTTLYKYFNNKYDLLEYAILQYGNIQLYPSPLEGSSYQVKREQTVERWDQLVDVIAASEDIVRHVMQDSLNPIFLTVLRQVADIRSADISHNLPENCPPERRKMFSDFMGRIQAGSMIAILLWWLEQEEPLHTGQMKRYIRDFFEVIESYEFPMDTFPSKPPSQEQK